MTNRLQIKDTAKRISLFIISLFLIFTVNFGVCGCEKKEEKQQLTGQSQISVPSKADIALLEGMMKNAQEDLKEARERDDKEQVNRKAREFNHYRTAVRHAQKMRNAYLEMRQAEKARDKEKAGSKLHVFQHYRCELYLLAESANETLAIKIR
jgi:hypothetical protein